MHISESIYLLTKDEKGFGSIGAIGLDGLIWKAEDEGLGPASAEALQWGSRRLCSSLYVPVCAVGAKLPGDPFPSLC